MKSLFFGLVPVCRKEALYIVRDRGTLFFALVIPMLQLFLFGFAIDTNIRQIATVVFDESQTQQSRQLLERFAASDVFALRGAVPSQEGNVRGDSQRQGSSRHPHTRTTMPGACSMARRRPSWFSLTAPIPLLPRRLSVPPPVSRCSNRSRRFCRGATCRSTCDRLCSTTQLHVPLIFCSRSHRHSVAGHGHSPDRVEPGA